MNSCGTSDAFNTSDFRNLLFQQALDTHTERHLRTGAAGACASKPYLDDTLVVYFHEFDVTAVCLEHGANFRKHLLNLLSHDFSLPLDIYLCLNATRLAGGTQGIFVPDYPSFDPTGGD